MNYFTIFSFFYDAAHLCVRKQEQTGLIAIFNWIRARGATVKPVTFRYVINAAVAAAVEQISIAKQTNKVALLTFWVLRRGFKLPKNGNESVEHMLRMVKNRFRISGPVESRV